MRVAHGDSYVNPHAGIVAMGEAEVGQYFSDNYQTLRRIGAGIQGYTELFSPGVVGALRVSGQLEDCDKAPLWMLLPLGGTTSLRGYPMDRFLGTVAVLTNAEVRCPLYKRLGGVVFVDAGTVAGSAEHFRVSTLHVAPGFGLRMIFDTFVVRGDIGFSNEGGGLYLNFGHMF